MITVRVCVNAAAELLKEKKLVGAALDPDPGQGKAKLLVELKRTKDSLFYSEDKVESLTGTVQDLEAVSAES
jgi:hypothetical protein